MKTQLIKTLGFILIAAAASFGSANADIPFQQFTVTTTADAPAIDPSVSEYINNRNDVSLRSAIQRASYLAGINSNPLLTATIDCTGVSGTITLGSSLVLIVTPRLTITGPGAGNLTISGNNASGVLVLSPGTTTTLSGLTIANGSAAQGGGIYNASTLFLNNCAITGNSATNGGGLFNDGGTTTITNTTLNGNVAPQGNGGGIYNNFGGTVNVISSTLSGNSAQGNGGGIFQSFGGTIDVFNSTLSGNSAPQGSGGGIYITAGSLVVESSTLSGNSAHVQGGGILNYSASVEIGNTILNAGAEGENIASPNTTPILSDGHNLSSDGGGGYLQPSLGDLISIDPMLGALGNNGGPTFTHPLLPGSPAIDAGSNSLIPVDPGTGQRFTTDQRGLPRIAGGIVDIGAFELQTTVTGSAPRPQLVAIQTGLRNLGTLTDNGDQNKLADALKNVANALKPGNWVDDSHLTHGGVGHQVFASEQQVVQDLQQLISNNRSGLTAATLKPLIVALVQQARSLAQIAINEAPNAPHIQNALNDLAKGDAYSNSTNGNQTNMQNAVNSYGNAWNDLNG